jgi:hypothetical protein
MTYSCFHFFGVFAGMMFNPSGFAQLPPAALRLWNEETVPYKVDDVLRRYGASSSTANQFTERVEAHAESAKEFMLRSGVSPMWDVLQLEYAEKDQGKDAEWLKPEIRNATEGITFFVQEFHSKKGVCIYLRLKFEAQRYSCVIRPSWFSLFPMNRRFSSQLKIGHGGNWACFRHCISCLPK